MAKTSLYFDANADTVVRPEALAALIQAERETPYNPASLHRPGRRAQGVLEDARTQVARLLGCEDRDVVFTSGATEACNLALFGMVRGQAAAAAAPLRLLSSPSEHPAVLGPLRMLQAEGHHLQLLPVDRHGGVPQAALSEALEAGADLVALQWANNETGVVQPLEVVAEHAASATNFFCDAVQGLGKLPLPAALQSADCYALSGHKFGAPKGIGVLIERGSGLLEPLLGGGGQQRGRRPGTEAPALAAAFACALDLALAEQQSYATTARACGEAFWLALTGGLHSACPGAPRPLANHPQGPERALPNTLCISFPGLDGRLLMPACDATRIAVSTGSACSSGAPTPSSVLLAAGLSEDLARATLRISMDHLCTPAYALEGGARLAGAVARLYELAIG